MKEIPARWKWIALGLILSILFLSSDSTRSYWKKRRYYSHLKKQLEEIKTKNKNLKIEIERLKNDPSLIGEVARKELRMSKPGEIEYRFVIEPSSKN
ncbi:MAG: hypothetical protein A3I11_02610 [Elusimicrobia bacterium RIFCSPLOWO2_02_FULL_39_32]|nr:MAG: hypothetical protein A2034_05275 [Elusimicrobia bacterium GWA2_38_7]OGR80329.1 MAG: hypothetical protein A3B80_01415 [Elusimicrobia bacterium RIFCSPHIGHO2_02_FULL_39_36]OGR93623.1 MAG: hypothetical protein A3I11_02610 [Elusimicrobia bacterium RIFCSPLOWO2_02_FULL_39_32]OGS00444.1 MAG: hypothetical protein A3G85_09040 [Elusimicrobia bacterium RIFCSPLOWO2_12_FULL_39_28]